MDTLEKEILIALLGSHRSIYALEKSFGKSNYTTVRRHIKRFQKEKLLRTIRTLRKDGKPDNRKAESPELTPKGLATLLIEGDLKEEELKKAMTNTLQKDYAALPPNFLGVTNADKIFTDTLLRMRHKINLKYFDEQYFNEVFNVSLGESLFEYFLRGSKIPKRTMNQKQAQKLKNKYISNQTTEDFRNLQKTFENESDKFKHYSNVMSTVIQALTAPNS